MTGDREVWSVGKKQGAVLVSFESTAQFIFWLQNLHQRAAQWLDSMRIFCPACMCLSQKPTQKSKPEAQYQAAGPDHSNPAGLNAPSGLVMCPVPLVLFFSMRQPGSYSACRTDWLIDRIDSDFLNFRFIDLTLRVMSNVRVITIKNPLIIHYFKLFTLYAMLV